MSSSQMYTWLLFSTWMTIHSSRTWPSKKRKSMFVSKILELPPSSEPDPEPFSFSVIATTIRSERLGFEEMQKKYGELWLALEKTLEPARGDAADDVITIDKKTSESRDMIDTLFAVDFEIPGQILPEPHPFTFGQVYGDAANSSTSKLGRRSATLSSKKSGKATSTADGKKDRRSRRSSTTSPSTSPAMANPEKKPRASSKATKPAQASTSKTLAKPPKPDGSSSTATTTPPPAISIAVPTEKSGNTMSQSTDRLMVGQSASPAEDRSTPGSEAAKTSAGASAATSQKNPDGKITLGSSAPKDGPIASSGSTNWADEDDEDIPEPPEDDGLAFSDSDQDEGNADYTFSGETPRLESPTQSDEEESDEYIIPIQSFISRPNRASRGPDSDLAITPRMMNEDLELSGSHLPGPSYETDSE